MDGCKNCVCVLRKKKKACSSVREKNNWTRGSDAHQGPTREKGVGIETDKKKDAETQLQTEPSLRKQGNVKTMTTTITTGRKKKVGKPE